MTEAQFVAVNLLRAPGSSKYDIVSVGGAPRLHAHVVGT